MDMIALAMAKAYSDSKGGYTENKVLVNDGNTNGKETVNYNGMAYVRIGDAIAVKDITRFLVFDGEGDRDVLMEYCTITEDNGISAIECLGVVGVIISSGANGEISSGTYALNESFAYVKRVETETITPIGQKYLPGVCLPVVELSTEFTDGGATLTSEECVKLDNVAAIGLPIVVKFLADGNVCSGVFTLTADADRYAFTFSMNGITFVLQDNGVSWDAFVYVMG